MRRKQLPSGARVFVTGGTGFVGSHVVQELVRQGAHVVTTYLIDEPKSYFSTTQLEKKVTKVHLDIRNFEGIKLILDRFNIEYILHLAAQPLVDVAMEHPMHTLDTNIMGTATVLEAARLTKGIQGILVASSDKAYGKHGERKYVETDPLRGDHPYEVSKSAADLICTTYAHSYGVPVVITRFGNIYGEGDLNMSRIIPSIMESVLLQKELLIRSNGTYVRDYLYVKDVVRGYTELLTHIDKVRGEAFNFGSKETLTVLQVIKIVEKVLRKKIRFRILNTSKNEIPYQSLDYAKIYQTCKWSPQFSLEDTVMCMYKWYKKVLLP